MTNPDEVDPAGNGNATVSKPSSRSRRRRSSIPRALIAGAIAAAMTGIFWALVIAVFNRRVGFLAIGVGFAVGFSVRHFGRGRTEVFGVIAMLLAMMGCAIGDILGGIVLVAESAGVPLAHLLSRLNGGYLADIFRLMFTPMDIIFYLIALFTSYKYAVVSDEF